IWEEASYVMPCCHRFCFTCIWQWADSKPKCPLCKRRVSSIVHLVRVYDNFEEYVVRPPTASSGRECSPGGPQRSLKRKAGSPEASSPPNKRPTHQQL
uniref:RING-type E3 ubiquitin transferase n=1 Tax=Aquila chrysaetos chrysaetos TaxID=223781 RepID=A0A663EZP9_AQUCH